jgi:hypothetical protein
MSKFKNIFGRKVQNPAVSAMKPAIEAEKERKKKGLPNPSDLRGHSNNKKQQDRPHPKPPKRK